jgi:hypothetical protein
MHSTHENRDDGVSVLAGIDPPSSLRSAWADNVIQFPSPIAAALDGWEDAGEPLDEDVFDLGSLAVRLIGTFQFPRLLVMRQDQS